jgi:hypothetical protein
MVQSLAGGEEPENTCAGFGVSQFEIPQRLASRFSNGILAICAEDGEMKAGHADVSGNVAHAMQIVNEPKPRGKTALVCLVGISVTRGMRYV